MVEVNFSFARATRPASRRRLSQVSDGDTPTIDQPIRMVSCDTPEKAQYAGGPAKSQPKLDACRERLSGNFYQSLPRALRDYFIARLTDDAAERHVEAGTRAWAVFQEVLDRRLVRPDGNRRSLAVIPTGEVIDSYGRMLAYLAPWFAGTDADPLPPRDDPRRRTFNLEMVENGWAAFFPIYPSLPNNADFNLAIAAAATAWDEKRGAWEEFGEDLLLAYEFRACIKLGTAATAEEGIAATFQRVCVDLRDMRAVGLYGFSEVPPPYRMWIWESDMAAARDDLGIAG